MTEDPRCCGSGTCIIDATGRCWCGQQLGRPLDDATALARHLPRPTAGLDMPTPEVPVFVISRQFSASPEQVYAAWADPKNMVQWSGPKGSSVEFVRGSQAEGQLTITRTASPAGPEMFSLCLWRELTPHRRVVWEQSFCTREGIKCPPPFFDDWPRTLLTEVSLEPHDGGTLLTLKWTPVEHTEAALAMFSRQMASMTGGWGGSLDKLDEWLAR